jgi:hypothetical protein
MKKVFYPDKFCIVAGFIGTSFFGWLIVQLLMCDPFLSQSNIEYASGILQKTEEKQSSRSLNLHLWLKGKSQPFIASSIQYPQAYKRGSLDELVPGAKIKIGYEKENSRRGLIPASRMTTSNLYIATLEIDGHEALSLEASNSAKSTNMFGLRIIVSLLLVVNLAMIKKGWVYIEVL